VDAPILELRGVSKHFGAVVALHEVDFHVSPGEVMALVGDNGAGKSTLIKCIAGIHRIDAGEVRFNGEPVSIAGPKDAATSGSRSSTRTSRSRQPGRRPEHVPGPRDGRRLRRLDEPKMESRAKKTLADLSVTTIRSVRQTVAGLSGGQRSPSPWPRRSCGTRRWSSSTSRPPRSASRRPGRSSTSSGAWASRAWPSS
jgi:D-xylose transport system ATP-binding protein